VPVRLGPVGPLLVGGVDLLHVAHADDADVAARRDGLDAVLGLAPAERPQPRPEAQEELGDLHARPFGHDEMAELVEHDHPDDGHQHPDGAGQPGAGQGEDGRSGHHHGDGQSRPAPVHPLLG
jgi:hypothetical protein